MRHDIFSRLTTFRHSDQNVSTPWQTLDGRLCASRRESGEWKHSFNFMRCRGSLTLAVLMAAGPSLAARLLQSLGSKFKELCPSIYVGYLSRDLLWADPVVRAGRFDYKTEC